jgi:hypothetical protein
MLPIHINRIRGPSITLIIGMRRGLAPIIRKQSNRATPSPMPAGSFD